MGLLYKIRTYAEKPPNLGRIYNEIGLTLKQVRYKVRDVNLLEKIM